MSEAGDTLIAGLKTCEDWWRFRDVLEEGTESSWWDRAFEEYFRPRLQLRYLNPIRVMQESDTRAGEGFSIVAIHCTLIEFLEATLQGINYRWVHRDKDLRPYEYRQSGPVFTAFLSERQPFSDVFDAALAQDFYANVRCALLHEARTRNGWKIRARGSAGGMVDAEKRLLFRNEFHKALMNFIEWYKVALSSDPSLQQAFLRKFDSLCV